MKYAFTLLVAVALCLPGISLSEHIETHDQNPKQSDISLSQNKRTIRAQTGLYSVSVQLAYDGNQTAPTAIACVYDASGSSGGCTTYNNGPAFGYYNPGDQVTVSVDRTEDGGCVYAGEGEVFDQWNGDPPQYNSSNPVYTFTMPAENVDFYADYSCQ